MPLVAVNAKLRDLAGEHFAAFVKTIAYDAQ